MAKLERGVSQGLRNGVQIIGRRITLLDGTGAVVDLGDGRLRIAPGKMCR